MRTHPCWPVLFLLALIGCIQDGTAPDTTAITNAAPELTVAVKAPQFKVELRDGQMMIAGTRFRFPTTLLELSKIVGQPTRTLSLANVVYVWDHLGIVGYRPQNQNEINSLDFTFVNEGFEFSPTTNFAGTFTVRGAEIDKNATPDELGVAGFASDDTLPFLYTLDFPPHSVIAEIDGSITGVSISQYRK